MLRFDILTAANQKFRTILNGNRFSFEFRTYRGVIYCSVFVNDELEQGGVKGVQNTSLFNSKVNELAGGVFMMRSSSVDYPSFRSNGTPNFEFVFIPFGE